MFRISTCVCARYVRKEEISVMLLNGLSAWPLFLTFCHFQKYTSEGNMCLGKKYGKQMSFCFCVVVFFFLSFFCVMFVARGTFIL